MTRYSILIDIPGHSRVEYKGENGVLICNNNCIATLFNHDIFCKNTRNSYFVLVLLLLPLCLVFLCLAVFFLDNKLTEKAWAGCFDNCTRPLSYAWVDPDGGQGVWTPHPENKKKCFLAILGLIP